MEIVHIKSIKDMQYGKLNILIDDCIPDGEVHIIDKKQLMD